MTHRSTSKQTFKPPSAFFASPNILTFFFIIFPRRHFFYRAIISRLFTADKFLLTLIDNFTVPLHPFRSRHESLMNFRKLFLFSLHSSVNISLFCFLLLLMILQVSHSHNNFFHLRERSRNSVYPHTPIFLN